MTKTRDQEICERIDAIEAEHDGLILRPPAAVRLDVTTAKARHEEKLDALEAAHAGLEAEHAELAAKDLAVTPLDGDTMQIAEIRRKFIGKRLEGWAVANAARALVTDGCPSSRDPSARSRGRGCVPRGAPPATDCRRGQPMTIEVQAALPTETEFFAMIPETAQLEGERVRYKSYITAAQRGKDVVTDDPIVRQIKRYVVSSLIAQLATVEQRLADIGATFRQLRKGGTSASWLDAHDPEIETTRRRLEEIRAELAALRMPRQGLDIESARREETLVPEQWRLEARTHNRVEQLLTRLAQEALADAHPATSGEKGA